MSDFYVAEKCVFTARVFSMMVNRAKQCLSYLLPGEDGVYWTMSVKPGQHIPVDDPRMTIESVNDDDDTEVAVFIRKVRSEDDFNYAMVAAFDPTLMLLGSIDRATKLKATGKRRFNFGEGRAPRIA